MCGLPILYSQTIEKDYRWMQAHGIRGEFIEAEGAADEGVTRMHRPATQHLNLYLTARLGWDPTLNVQDLLAEYYRLFYGPAEAEMKEFWTFAETVRTTAGARLATVAAFQPESVFTPEALARLADLLARGRAKTPEGSVYRKRIELLEKEFTPARRALVPVLRSGEQTLELPLLATAEDVEALTPTRLLSLAGEAMPDPTWIKVGWTPEGLHLDILCFERSMDRIRAVCTAHDQTGLRDDDCVEVFLNPDPKDARKSYHYIVNSKGAICGRAHRLRRRGGRGVERDGEGLDVRRTQAVAGQADDPLRRPRHRPARARVDPESQRLPHPLGERFPRVERLEPHQRARLQRLESLRHPRAPWRASPGHELEGRGSK